MMIAKGFSIKHFQRLMIKGLGLREHCSVDVSVNNYCVACHEQTFMIPRINQSIKLCNQIPAKLITVP